MAHQIASPQAALHIGIMQCGHAPAPVADRFGDFDRMFAHLLGDQGLTFSAFDVHAGRFPASCGVCDGWLLTGSRHGVYDDLPFIAPLEAFIRDAYTAEVPMVGICFGHQIIAQALGGQVEKFQGGWSIGSNRYTFDGMGPVTLNAWHQDQVVRKPAQARVIGASEFCAHAGLVYGHRALTLQPHPEFSSAVVAQMARECRGDATADYPGAMIEAAVRMGDGAWVDQDRFARLIGDFFRDGVARVQGPRSGSGVARV